MNKELQWWWPLALNDALGSEPLAVRLLDQSLVLWRDAQGQPVLMTDQCPHRGARLSLGKVQGNDIECAYHGWRFDPQGACVGVPALPGFQPPEAHKACRHPVMEQHGLLWGAVGDAAYAPPALPELPQRRLIYGPFDVATSAPRAVENFLDTAHFAFVHRDWLGDAGHPEVPHYDVTQTADGRPVIEAYKAWQPRATASATDGGWVTYRYEVLSPYSALLSKQPDDGGPQDSYTIWACPVSDDSCRLWFGQYTSDTSSTDEALRDFQVTIFSQDQPILESQQPKQLPIHGGEVHSAADRLSAAYRRYLKLTGVSCGVC